MKTTVKYFIQSDVYVRQNANVYIKNYIWECRDVADFNKRINRLTLNKRIFQAWKETKEMIYE